MECAPRDTKKAKSLRNCQQLKLVKPEFEAFAALSLLFFSGKNWLKVGKLSGNSNVNFYFHLIIIAQFGICLMYDMTDSRKLLYIFKVSFALSMRF